MWHNVCDFCDQGLMFLIANQKAMYGQCHQALLIKPLMNTFFGSYQFESTSEAEVQSYQSSCPSKRPRLNRYKIMPLLCYNYTVWVILVRYTECDWHLLLTCAIDLWSSCVIFEYANTNDSIYCLVQIHY